MTTTQANLINSLSLISFSLWGYFSSETPSSTSFISAGIGTVLFLCSSGIKNENRNIAHLAVLLTLLAIGGLTMALLGSLKRSDDMAVIRVSIMIFTCVIAMISFVRSFIAARK